MKQENIDDVFKKRADDRAAKGDAKSPAMGYVKGKLNDKTFEYAADELFPLAGSWYMAFSNAGKHDLDIVIRIPEEAFNTEKFKLSNVRDLFRVRIDGKFWELNSGDMYNLKKDENSNVTGTFRVSVYLVEDDDLEIIPIEGEISIFLSPKNK